jgi:hypothetical protein
MARMDESVDAIRTTPLESLAVPELAAAFERFVEAESPKFHGALRLLTRDRIEAEDLMQDAFLKVWERWEHDKALVALACVLVFGAFLAWPAFYEPAHPPAPVMTRAVGRTRSTPERGTAPRWAGTSGATASRASDPATM